jgi:hypothetical protein
VRIRKQLALLALGPLAVAGCMRSGGSPMGVPLRERTQFESQWRSYQRLSGLKALAVAGDLEGVYVSGFAFSYPIQALADDEALETCEQRRTDRRIEDACRLYAIGDERVEDAGSE